MITLLWRLNAYSHHRETLAEESKSRLSTLGQRLLIFFLLLFVTPGHSVAAQFETFLEPNKVIDLSSSFRDRLNKLLVVEGQTVQAGQILAELNTNVLRAQLARAKLASSFHAEVDGAANMVKMRKNRLALLQELEKSGNTRPQELTMARTELAMAVAELQGAREARQLRKLEANIVETQLAEKIMTSPVDGVVLKIYKQEAELVGGGDSQPLMTLVQLDPLLAVFHLPPAMALQVKRGQELSIQVNQQNIPATVVLIAPIINAQSGTVEMQLEVPNPESTLIAGSLGTLTLPESDLQDITQQAVPR